jgi:hypothetical protein
MDIFISWSSDASKEVALALRGWLPSVIQALKPWVSEQDIGKGQRGLTAIAEQLERCRAGILCVTSENGTAPWLMFEAGALGKTVRESRVVPFLLDIQPKDLHSVLGQFQAARANKEETLGMLRTFNEALGAGKLPDALLTEAFERRWPDLEGRLDEAKKLLVRGALRVSVEDRLDELARDMRTLIRRTSPLSKEMDQIDELLAILSPVEEKVLRMRAGYDGVRDAGAKRLLELIEGLRENPDDSRVGDDDDS